MVGDYMFGNDVIVPAIAAGLTQLLSLEVRTVKTGFSEVTRKGAVCSPPRCQSLDLHISTCWSLLISHQPYKVDGCHRPCRQTDSNVAASTRAWHWFAGYSALTELQWLQSLAMEPQRACASAHAVFAREQHRRPCAFWANLRCTNAIMVCAMLVRRLFSFPSCGCDRGDTCCRDETCHLLFT